MSFFVRGRFTVHSEHRAEFEELALTLATRAADEPGTLTYRWFTADQDTYVVLEEYTDGDAAMAHNERSADLIAKVGEYAELTAVEVHGTPGPQVEEWLRASPVAVLLPDFTG